MKFFKVRPADAIERLVENVGDWITDHTFAVADFPPSHCGGREVGDLRIVVERYMRKDSIG